MKKDFVKGIAVGCALSMAIGGASALADTYRKFLEVAYTDIKVVVNGKPTTPRDSDGTPVKPFISSGTTYLPVRSISNALGQNVDWDSDTSTIYIGDKLETDKVNMAEIEPVEGTHILNSSSATFPLRQVTIVPDNRFAPYSSTLFILDGKYSSLEGLFAVPDRDNDDDINAVQFINEDTVNMAEIEPVEGTHILNSSSATFPLRQVTIVPDNRFAPYSSTLFILDGKYSSLEGLFAVPDRDNDDDINAVQFINEDTDEVLATVSNKRLEKAVDVKVNLIGVDKLRVKAGRISDDNNFEFGYNGGYLYNLYLTPITQK